MTLAMRMLKNIFFLHTKQYDTWHLPLPYIASRLGGIQKKKKKSSLMFLEIIGSNGLIERKNNYQNV